MRAALALISLVALALDPASGQTPIPENDSFATRIALFGANVATTGDNVGATKEIGEPDPNFAGGRSVWWTWTAPADGNLAISTAGSSFDTMLTVFTGDAISNLTLVAFNDTESTTSTVTFNVVAGTAYQIAVDGVDGTNSTGNISLQLTLGPTAPPPANDNFANRITLTGAHLNNAPGSNVGATAEPGEPFHADVLGLKSVWWTWTAPFSGGLTLTSLGTSTRGGPLDTALAIYTGDSVSGLTLVAGNDEDDFGYESTVTCNVTSNVTYHIVVDGYEGDQGEIRLRLDLETALPVPANDDFANRKALSGSVVTTNGSNIGATFELGEPAHMLIFGGKSVWYRWTAPSSGSVTLSVSNDLLDTIVSVYRGTSLADLTFVAGNDENFLTPIDGDSIVYFNVTAGTVYQIAVDGLDGDTGNFRLRLTMDAADPVPPNNSFGNSIVITGTNTTVTGSNIGATLQAGEPVHRGYYGGNSVWWRWTSPAAGFVTIDTIGSLCDTILAVYTGSTISDLTEIASDDNSGGTENYNSLVTFPTRPNVTYHIAVDGYDGDAWDLRLRVRFARATYSLTVTTNPPGAGSVAVSPLPDQAGEYVPGAIVTMTATPSAGATFTGWSGSASSSDNPLTFAMTSDKTVTANFQTTSTTRFWTGAHPQSGNWTDPANWSEGKPKAGDKLVFPAGGLRLSGNTNDFPPGTVFDSITFSGDGYVLRGNGLGLNNGIDCTNSSGLNTINLNVQLGTNQSIQCANATAQLVVAGDVVLGNHTLTVESTGDVTLAGAISGTGGIIKNSSGMLSLVGSNPNTFGGATVVNEGSLQLAKTGVAVPGALIIGDGIGGASADVVRFDAASQLASSSAVTVNNSGRLNLNGFVGTVGSLTMSGGNVDSGSGSVGLNGNVTVNPSSSPANITGSLSLQGATRTFNVADGAAAIDLLVSAVISDGGINKTGTGRLHLAGANTYAGTTTVNEGTLAIFHSSALGAADQGTVVNTGAMLSLNGVAVNGEPLTLARGTLESSAGSNAWAGNIQLNNACVFTTAESTTLNLSGVISGTGSLTKGAEGTLILSGPLANTYSGVTTVNHGRLLLAKTTSNAIPGPLVVGAGPGNSAPDVVQVDTPQQISIISEVTINGPGVLELNSTDSIAALSGDGKIMFGNANATLSVGHGNTSTTFSGLISGAGGLAKAGTGTLMLSANNTYTGQTLVNDGALIVAGSQPGSSVLVNSPGSLGGTGRVGNLSGSGAVSPGSSPGVLLAGNVDFLSSATYRVELNGPNPSSGYDQLNVTGTVNLAGTLNATLGFTPGTNQSFTIIENDGSDAITGTFNGLSEGQFLLIGEALFRISYAAGPDSNDVVLSRTAPPPSTIGSLAFIGNGRARVQGVGEAGLSYVLEFAPTLNAPILWTPLSTNTADATGAYQLTDPGAQSFPMRFYRVRSLP